MLNPVVHPPTVPAAYQRKPIEQVLNELESRAYAGAPSCSTHVSGACRLDCEYRHEYFQYYVNGRASSREDAADALELARREWVRKYGI